MQLTFTSRALDRVVTLADIARLKPTELRELHAELTMAVQAMDEKVQETKELERASGIAADEDWLHRVKKKRRVCVTLAAQVNQALSTGESSFEYVYRFKLEELLLEELGDETLREIKGEAMQFALASHPQAIPAA
jgi:hypothetical protein